MLWSNVNINRHSTRHAFPSVNTPIHWPQMAEFSIKQRRIGKGSPLMHNTRLISRLSNIIVASIADCSQLIRFEVTINIDKNFTLVIENHTLRTARGVSRKFHISYNSRDHFPPNYHVNNYCRLQNNNARKLQLRALVYYNVVYEPSPRDAFPARCN